MFKQQCRCSTAALESFVQSFTGLDIRGHRSSIASQVTRVQQFQTRRGVRRKFGQNRPQPEQSIGENRLLRKQRRLEDGKWAPRKLTRVPSLEKTVQVLQRTLRNERREDRDGLDSKLQALQKKAKKLEKRLGEAVEASFDSGVNPEEKKPVATRQSSHLPPNAHRKKTKAALTRKVGLANLGSANFPRRDSWAIHQKREDVLKIRAERKAAKREEQAKSALQSARDRLRMTGSAPEEQMELIRTDDQRIARELSTPEGRLAAQKQRVKVMERKAKREKTKIRRDREKLERLEAKAAKAKTRDDKVVQRAQRNLEVQGASHVESDLDAEEFVLNQIGEMDHEEQRSTGNSSPQARSRFKPKALPTASSSGNMSTSDASAEFKKESEPWQIQKAALKEKFGDVAWNPRKRLSPDTLNGIRTLHASDPTTYSTQTLAQHFAVSPEAVRRILKSKWQPTEEEAKDRLDRWERRGQRKRADMAEKEAVRRAEKDAAAKTSQTAAAMARERQVYAHHGGASSTVDKSRPSATRTDGRESSQHAPGKGVNLASRDWKRSEREGRSPTMESLRRAPTESSTNPVAERI